jgi:ornithine cyclodeaminase/alanine dehydrogenase-like protein (mu-crystallin family)
MSGEQGPGTALLLRAHEVESALEVIDPVAVLAEQLIGRTVGRPLPRGRIRPWVDSGEYVVLDDPDATPRCVLPAHSLHMAQAAALTAVAARELLPAGGVTVAVLGSGDCTQPQLPLLARHVPDISHVALCLVGGPEAVEPRFADLLELSGIRLSVVDTLAEAVFGANLVVATNHSAPNQNLDNLRLGQLAHGAVLVNSTGKDPPSDLVDRVDQVFVDDLGLLAGHLDRHVVAAHLAGHPDGAGRRITADLPELLTGRHTGRQRMDDVVLVELLGVDEPNVELANRIYEGAKRTGLGERIAD